MGESRNIAIVSGVASEDNAAEIEWQSLKRGFLFQGSKFFIRHWVIWFIRVAIFWLSNFLVRNQFLVFKLHCLSKSSRLPCRPFSVPFQHCQCHRLSLHLRWCRTTVFRCSDPSNRTRAEGFVVISSEQQESCGYNIEHQDAVITLVSSYDPADNFHGLFCIRSNARFEWHGPIGGPLGAYAFFSRLLGNFPLFIARVGASFISIDQARKNLWLEIPDAVSDMTDRSKLMIGTSEYTAVNVRRQWEKKLDGLEIEGASNVEKYIFSTAVAQYPSQQHEFILVSIWQRGRPHWIWRGIRYWLFSFGYFLCSMGTADSTLPWTYTWFCQLHAGWVSASTHLSPISDLTDWLFRVVAFLCGRTHADSLVAESVKKSATGSNRELAWQALWMMQLCPLGMMWQPSIAIEKRFRHCSL